MVSMINQQIENYLKKKPNTLLCIGPMSVNCVDASIELANEYNTPLMLIASRRQIDSKDFGGGYVNNWSTEEFAKYVFKHDKNKKIFLARDHGGPWQNELEKINKKEIKIKKKPALKNNHKFKVNFMQEEEKPSVEEIKNFYDNLIKLNNKASIIIKGYAQKR